MAQNNIDLPENKAALKITERYLLKTVVPADCLAFSHDGKKLMSTISRAQPKNRDAWKELTFWDLTQEKAASMPIKGAASMPIKGTRIVFATRLTAVC